MNFLSLINPDFPPKSCNCSLAVTSVQARMQDLTMERDKDFLYFTSYTYKLGKNKVSFKNPKGAILIIIKEYMCLFEDLILED